MHESLIFPVDKPKDGTKEKPSRKSDASPERNVAAKPAPRPSVGKVTKDPDAIRTVVISGLSSSIDQKALWKKVRKCAGAERVELVDGVEGVGEQT